MDIFSVITLFGGLAFFLYGMHLLSSSLEKMVGGKLERILRSMTSNRFKALLLGMGITIAIQSSSAMTVMLVGLVNSGIMELGQTIGVIMGSNIGTTVTAWILSLSGITSDNVFVQLLKPESFSPIVALIGIILIMFTKSSKKKDIGSVCVGFAILMTGMTMMSGAVKPLADLPQFKEVLTILDNPIIAILVGAGIGTHPELRCFARHSAVSRHDGQHFVQHGAAGHYGPEHRYMYHGAAFLHRHHKKRKARDRRAYLL